MLLALDVGNTNIMMGVYEGADLRAHWRVRTVRDRTADEHGVLLRSLFAAADLPLAEVDGIAISNVVPPMAPPLAQFCRKYLGLKPEFVGADIAPKIGVRYRPPSDVGADRLVDAIAVLRRYGGPAVVVDFGTATTFDAISADGEYLGGAIAPGIGISLDALFHAAARLQRVELVRPPCVIGQTTSESIQSGVIFGFVGQVEGIVARLREVLGAQARVIATGGLAELIAAETSVIDVIDPFLTLEGLRITWHEHHCRR
jgi:type III pantothenate kinase